MEKLYKNIFNIKALMLVLLTSLLAFGASAQTLTDYFPAGPLLVGEQDTVSYSADSYPAGTTFFLWNDIGTTANELDAEDVILGQSTADTTGFIFTIPSGTVSLRLEGFTGNTFDFESILPAVSSTTGTGSQGYDYTFNQVALRSITTLAVDVSSSDSVRLDVDVNSNNGDADNPLLVQYKLATGDWVTLTDETDTDSLIGNAGIRTYSLQDPANSGAKSASTSFRVIQGGTVDYGTGQSWEIGNDLLSSDGNTSGGFRIRIGDTYNDVGNQESFNPVVNTPTFANLVLSDLIDDALTGFTTGDTVKLTGELPGVDFTGISFTIGISNDNGTPEVSDDVEYLLDVISSGSDNDLDSFGITASVPAGVDFNRDGNDFDFNVYAYNGSEATFGIESTNDFTTSAPDENLFIELVGGTASTPEGIVFDEEGERQVTTAELNITSTDGTATLRLGRKNSLFSPAGNDILLQYSTDGSTFTNLDTIEINSLPVSDGNGGDEALEVVFDEWPAGVVSTSTQFRVTQISNNGADLDAWVLEELDLAVDETTLDYNNNGLGSLTFNRPNIDTKTIVLGGDGLAFPGETLNFNYEILSGIFPDDTEVSLYMDYHNDGNNPSFDLLLETVADISADTTIEFTVPALEQGSYALYLVTDNDESIYFGETLFINNLNLTITGIEISDPVDVGGEDFAVPGSDITVNYTLTGTPGTGASLVLSVFDDETDEYVEITSTTTYSGSISGALPTTIDFGPNPADFQLSIETGELIGNDFDFMTAAVDQEFQNDALAPAAIASIEGRRELELGGDTKLYALGGSGERVVTTIPVDISNGASIRVRHENWLDQDMNNESIDLVFEGSLDGEEWVEISSTTLGDPVTSGENVSFPDNAFIPNELWSDQTVFRIRYNEDGSAGLDENVVVPFRIEVFTPETLTTSETEFGISIIRPSLAVNAYDKTDFVIDEEVTVNYNAISFPASTEYAAVVSQGDEFFVLGTSATQDAGSITGKMPVILPLDEDKPKANYLLNVIPFAPATAGGDFMQGVTIDVGEEEDFLILEGDSSVNYPVDSLQFTSAGQRELLTRAFDLTMSDDVTVEFSFSNQSGNLSRNINKNLVPRFQVSTDGGQSFQDVLVEQDLDEGEEPTDELGYLYDNDNYEIELSSEFITEATHFRFFQPLNLGQNTNQFNVSDFEIVFDNGNALEDFIYTTTNNNNNANGGGGNQEITLFNDFNLDSCEFTQVDLQDAIFNGETFNASFDFKEGITVEDVDQFPAGTIFDFYLSGEEDPETGLDYLIGSATSLGEFEASVPATLFNGTYNIDVAAKIEVDGDMEYIIGEEGDGDFVGTLDVFLRAVETSLITTDEVLYAGSTLEFVPTIENNETFDASAESLFSTLVLTNYPDVNKDSVLILATLAGVDTFRVNLPPYIQSLDPDQEFEIRLSENEALGAVGSIYKEEGISVVAEDVIRGNSFPNLTYEASAGRDFITIGDYDSADLAAARLVTYDLDLVDGAGDFFANETVVFEYSIDGGLTYDTIAVYPMDVDAFNSVLEDEGGSVKESFKYQITDDMRSADVRFRWRQNEVGGSAVTVSNVNFTAGENIPFDYSSTDVDITPQALLITSLNATELCLDADIEIGYEVRGRMGVNNQVQVVATVNGTPYDLAETFNAFEDSNTLTVKLPDEAANAISGNQDVSFRLDYIDDTFSELDFDVPAGNYATMSNTADQNGTPYDQTIEFVGTIPTVPTVSVTNADLCEADPEFLVTINSPVDGWMYEVQDAAGTALGSLTYDAEEADSVIEITGISERTEIFIAVSSMSTSGDLTCNTRVAQDANLNDQFLYPRPNYQLASNEGGANARFEVVEAGEAFTICNSGNATALRLQRENANGTLDTDPVDNINVTQITWYRDNLNNIVTTNADSLSNSDITESGNYFAVITDGNCSYQTEIVAITVVETPDQPAITVASGDLNACEGADPVVLEAPEGFANYSWSGPGTFTANTRTIEVDTSGLFTVTVSNAASGSCASDAADSIVVNRYDNVDLRLTYDNNSGGSFPEDEILEGDVIESCENDLQISFIDNDDNATLGSGTIDVLLDGALLETTSAASYAVKESGEYSFVWTNDNPNVDCASTSVTFTVALVEVPESQIITSTGDLAFCEGEGAVTLTAPEGFAEYVWLRSEMGDTFDPINTTDPDFEAVSANTITVSTGGFYAVEVANLNGCNSAISNVIEVSQRATPPLPEVSPGFGLSVTQEESVCGSGAVTFAIAETEADYQYQLLDASTGQPSGDAVRGAESGDMFITSAAIEENTRFYLEISYADGTGCTEQYPDNTFEGSVNNVILEMDGNTIVAEISGGAEEITWFRNDVELRNRAGLTSISVIDAATYSVEVDFGNGCVITSNAVTLEASAEQMQTFFGELEVTSYPNPTTDDLKIDLVGGDLGDYTITLMNMSGQVVMSKAVTKSDDDMTEVLDLSAVEKGVYNLRIQRGNTVENVRIVKQ